MWFSVCCCFSPSGGCPMVFEECSSRRCFVFYGLLKMTLCFFDCGIGSNGYPQKNLLVKGNID